MIGDIGVAAEAAARAAGRVSEEGDLPAVGSEDASIPRSESSLKGDDAVVVDRGNVRAKVAESVTRIGNRRQRE